MSHNRKQVRASVNEFPEPDEGEEVAKVLDPRGSNQVLVELEDGSQRLVLIPSKFHKLLYLKKDSLVIVHMEEGVTAQKLEESKVQGALVCPLHSHQVEHLLAIDKLPTCFHPTDTRPKMTLDDLMPPSDSEEDDFVGRSLNARKYEESSSSE